MLFVFPLCRPLLEESLHSLLLVVGGEAEGEKIVLDGDGCVYIGLHSAANGLLAEPYGDRGVLGDGLCQSQCLVHKLLRLHNPVYQADSESLVCSDGLCGVNKLLGPAFADNSRKPLGS